MWRHHQDVSKSVPSAKDFSLLQEANTVISEELQQGRGLLPPPPLRHLFYFFRRSALLKISNYYAGLVKANKSVKGVSPRLCWRPLQWERTSSHMTWSPSTHYLFWAILRNLPPLSHYVQEIAFDHKVNANDGASVWFNLFTTFSCLLSWPFTSSMSHISLSLFHFPSNNILIPLSLGAEIDLLQSWFPPFVLSSHAQCYIPGAFPQFIFFRLQQILLTSIRSNLVGSLIRAGVAFDLVSFYTTSNQWVIIIDYSYERIMDCFYVLNVFK